MMQYYNSLYKLSTELQRVKEVIVSEEGVISPDLEIELDRLLPAIAEKAGGISRWIINLEGNINSIDSEIARLKKRKEVNDHLEKRLKTYLKDSMEKAGMTELDTGIVVVSVQKNPPSVSILDETEIPVEYELLTIVKTIDKKHLLEDLKAGKAISGVELVSDKTHLRLK